MKTRNKRQQQKIPKASVVLTINNRTNRVVSVESAISVAGVKPGKLIRFAMIRLLIEGFQQVSQFKGDKFTVIGYVLRPQQIPRQTVVLTINNHTNRLLVVSSSIPGPGLNAGIFARKGVFTLLMKGFRQVSQFRGEQFTAIGFNLK